MTKTLAARAALTGIAFFVLGCGSDGAKTKGVGTGYAVTIRGTSYGIPHVLADDMPSAAAGLGYVGARDFGCILLDQIVRVRSERARYFGPGDSGANLDSDFGMLTLGVRERGTRGLAAQSSELLASLDGYAAGFNYYLEKEHLATECDGKPWAKPIGAEDLFAYYYYLAQLGSDDPLFGALAAAAPPDPASTTAQSLSLKNLPLLQARAVASNGWAIGRDRTESGRGMLIANPHFPWEGHLKLYESHVSVPGTVDVYGASLLGVPVINIGFNKQVAWTHTVTTARHFTLYRLDLAPDDPTSYLYDGEPRAMTSTEFTIRVLQDDGSLKEEHRRLYRSHYGPMLDIPALGGWSAATAYTYRNANEDNFDIAEHWLQMNRAKSLGEMQQINDEVHGNPWTNTMAVDAGGTSLYMDATRVPNLGAGALSDYESALASDPITQAVDAQGAALLNGSDSKFEWQDGGDGAPGIVAFADSPVQERRDYVYNANDSYWITNSNEFLTGYSVLFGQERTIRSRRTRMNLTLLDEKTADGASGEDGKFSFDELAQVEFSDRAMAPELILEQLVGRCSGAPPVDVGGRSVDVSTACGVLEGWDGRYRLDSVGAALFREFLGVFSASTDLGPLFGVAFDPADPIATPRDLAPAPATGDDPAVVALARAVVLLEKAGFDEATPLGDIQHTRKGSEIIPIHGATNLDGAFNIVGYNPDDSTRLASTKRAAVVVDASGTADPTGLTSDGYLVNNGSSFMMALEFTNGGPHAVAVLSYSQSSDPASPHYADQTHLFSESKYRPVLYTEEEIEADSNLTVTELKIP